LIAAVRIETAVATNAIGDQGFLVRLARKELLGAKGSNVFHALGFPGFYENFMPDCRTIATERGNAGEKGALCP
jgi:hypothetical protein